MAISNILPKPIVARSQELAMAELGFSMTLKMKGYKDSKIPCPMRNAMLSITGKKLISNMKSWTNEREAIVSAYNCDEWTMTISFRDSHVRFVTCKLWDVFSWKIQTTKQKEKKEEGNDEFEQKASRNQRLKEYPWLAPKKGRGRRRRICLKE